MNTEQLVKPGRKALTRDEATAMIARIKAGDESARPELADYYRHDPIGKRLLTTAITPQGRAEAAALKQYACDCVFTYEATAAALDALRAEVCGEDPTPLEKILADRVVTTLFLVNRLEEYIDRPGGLETPKAEFAHRQLDRAHRRLLSAAKALATVRKLAAPSTRINLNLAQQNNAIGGSADVVMAIGD